MHRTRLTLFIPKLFSGFRAVAQSLRMPSLERLIARAHSEKSSLRSFEETVCSLFFCVSHGDLPIGALRRRGDGGSSDAGWWYCAEPVHYFADRDRLLLVPPNDLAITAEEANELARVFNGHFSEDGWYLEALHPERWYLRAPNPQDVTTTALSKAVQQPLWESLPQGTDALRWRAFLNEVQMLFHSQLINSAREAAGRSAVNGLWPWGGGPLPTLSRVFSDVWTDNPLVRGSALVSGATVHAIASPPCAPNAGNNGLIVMELPDTAQAWKIWDETWGVALHEFVRHGVVDELLILDGEGETFRVTRPALRRWWRRPKSLGKHPQ